LILSSCTAPASKDSTPSETSPTPAAETAETYSEQETKSTQETVSSEVPKGAELTLYTDQNGDNAYIPADFNVSGKSDEQTIRTGLVVIRFRETIIIRMSLSEWLCI